MVPKIIVGVFLGAVLAALPITYLVQFGMNQELHAGAAIVAASALMLLGWTYVIGL